MYFFFTCRNSIICIYSLYMGDDKNVEALDTVVARPAHCLSADDVQVDVEHRLAGISLAVEHKTGTAFFETEVLRDKLCTVEHLAHEFTIFRLHVHDSRDVALRHDQEVYRCLRGDVVEGENIVVFVDFLGRDFTLDDFAEKTIFTHSVINSSKKD